jgi:hypothetical protein
MIENNLLNITKGDTWQSYGKVCEIIDLQKNRQKATGFSHVDELC